MFARQIEVNVVNLMEQCNQWHQERQFKKIIDAIEAIPEHARSTEQIMELARAYNNYGLEHDYSFFEKTLELLRPIMQKMRSSPNFYLRYGFALLHTGAITGALECFLTALRFIDKNDHDNIMRVSLTKLARMCYDRLGDLTDFVSFNSKVKQTWANLKQIRDEVYNTLSKPNIGEKEATEIGSKVAEAFVFRKNFYVAYLKDSKKIVLTMLCGGSKEDLFEMSYFVSQRPKSFFGTDSWEFVIDTKPIPKAMVRNSVFTLKAEDIQVTICNGKRSTRFADVCLWAPSVALYLNDERRGPVVMEAITGLLDYSLGTICRMAFIDNVRIATEERDLTQGEYNEELGVFTLDKLYEKMTEIGFNTAITANEFLKQSYLSYDFDGNDQRYQPMRFDVFIGSTAVNSSIYEYYNYRYDIFGRLLEDGTIPGFFGFKLSHAVSDEAFASEMIGVRERCEKFFSELSDLPVQFTGGATGCNYCYIDFLNYEFCQSFLSMASEFFEQEKNVSEAFYAPLCAGVKATVLKGPGELVSEFTDGIEQYVLGKYASISQGK